VSRISTDNLGLMNDAAGNILAAIEWVQRALLGVGTELANLTMNTCQEQDRRREPKCIEI
jgi:hypothetical protein